MNFSDFGTEYSECYLSPRRGDYGPRAVLPKVPVKRSSSQRSVLSCDIDQDPLSDSSEYRLCFENYHPKRPYMFHEPPSHVFDYVPKPLNIKSKTKLPLNPSVSNGTEYQERFPNYRSFISAEELRPAHMSGTPHMQSETQRKREHMRRSQYFHQLVVDNERLNGGQRQVGQSEQRTAFQWPYHLSKLQQIPRQQQQEVPTSVRQPYYTPRNIYEPLPSIQRKSVNGSNYI